MQTEARVGVVVDGRGSAGGGGCSRGAVAVDGGASRKLTTQSQIGTVPQLLAGGVAGAISKTCTAPLARLTILFQLQGMHTDAASLKKASIWQEASRIVREEGFRAFWKGGGVAGITAASVTYPLDLVRTRLAAQTNVIYYRGIWHALQTISREEGIVGLYKGMGATLLGVGPNLAISFSVYDTVRSYWQSHRPDDSTVLVSLACGSLSGVASSTVGSTTVDVCTEPYVFAVIKM